MASVVTELTREIDRLTSARDLLTTEPVSKPSPNTHRSATKRAYTKRQKRGPMSAATKRKIGAAIRRNAARRRAIKKADSKA